MMRRILPSVIGVAMAMLLAAATLAQAADFMRIRTEAQFRSIVADRPLEDSFAGTMIYAGNGGIGGARDASRITGGWAWRGGALCHRMLIDGLEYDRDCLHVYLRGDTLITQAKRGRSTEVVWTIR